MGYGYGSRLKGLALGAGSQAATQNAMHTRSFREKNIKALQTPECEVNKHLTMLVPLDLCSATSLIKPIGPADAGCVGSDFNLPSREMRKGTTYQRVRKRARNTMF